MAFWTDKFMNKMRNEWLRRIMRIQYYAGGAWHDAAITEKRIVGNTMRIISVTTDAGSNTIARVRLIDSAGDVAAEIDENIRKTATQGVITQWDFPLYEITDT